METAFVVHLFQVNIHTPPLADMHAQVIKLI